MDELWTLVPASLPLPLRRLLGQAAHSIVNVGFNYLAVVAVFFTLWMWWRHRPGRARKLQSRHVAGSQIGREVAATVVSVLIFGSILPLLFALGFGKHTQIYWDAASRGWPYFFLSIVLMMAIQDTWFYWTHRLMHRRGWFAWFHRSHHRSTNTNPWTTYSVGPLEAVVLSGASIITLVAIPTTGMALFAMSLINTIYGVYGHLGYELYPKSMATHWLGRWMNTSVAHNTHHARGRYNYGYFFLIWDRMMGTVDPDYEARYARAHAGEAGEGKTQAGVAPACVET